MIGFRKGFLTVVTAATLAGSLLLPDEASSQTTKRPDEVVVTNTPANAIPTVAQGTTTVAGSIDIANTPTVVLAPGTTVGIGNTDQAPVPIVDVNDAREPFQRWLVFTIDPGGQAKEEVFEVPSGKRLVIEHISSRIDGPAGHKYIAWLDTRVNDSGIGLHYLVLTHQGTFASGTADLFTASQPMRVYAELEPSNPIQPRLQVNRSASTGTSLVQATVSGYLVNQ